MRAKLKNYDWRDDMKLIKKKLKIFIFLLFPKKNIIFAKNL